MADNLECEVAVIGGGPAGVAAALALRKAGLARVTIVEREAEIGGVPRHCTHSPFGVWEFGRILFGPVYARRLTSAANRAGITMLTSTTVTALHPDATLSIMDANGSGQLKAKRVVLATGARESSRAARMLPGDRPVGVVTTGMLQHAICKEGFKPFHTPVVIGTELVSLSAVLTCRLAGIAPAAIVEERSRPTVHRPLDLFPRLLGIPMHYDVDILDIKGKGRVEAMILRLGNGQIKQIACDGILLTGSFLPEAPLVRISHLVVDAGSGGPVIDQYGRCSDPSYYAAGNLLRAVETAGWSFREGTKVGRAVAADLSGDQPAAKTNVAIQAGAGIKLVVPQRIALPDAGGAGGYLQIRVSDAARGRIVLRNGGGEFWSRRVSALPERRILIPTRPMLDNVQGSDVVTIAMER